jgi:hypothetical protein
MLTDKNSKIKAKYSNYNIKVEFSKEKTEELTFLCCACYSKKYNEIFVEL